MNSRFEFGLGGKGFGDFGSTGVDPHGEVVLILIKTLLINDEENGLLALIFLKVGLI